MRLGIWVPIYRRTLPIPHNLSRSFGLSEGSQLHLAPSPDRVASDRTDPHTLSAEIIVSPVPIQSWRSACRLSVRLRNKPGALACATKFLKEQRINILITEACATYQQRAHWDAICDIAQNRDFEALRSRSRESYEQAMGLFLERLTLELHGFI
jgi:hypothetical protein